MSVLVLNAGWTPIAVEPIRKSLKKLWKGKAQVVGEDYDLHDFRDWCDLRMAAGSRRFVMPEVIRLTEYDRVHTKGVKLNRYNLFARDKNICGYCGRRFKVRDLTWDHVIPRGQGGRHRWDNLVAACGPCNHMKANRTPAQAGMRLLATPRVPDRVLPLRGLKLTRVPKRWEDFVDLVYWNVELED